MLRLSALQHHSVLEHPGLATEYSVRSRPKERYAYVLPGLSAPNRVLQINDGSIHTLRTALLERMFYCRVDAGVEEPPQIPRATIECSLSKFRNKIIRHYGPKPTPVSPEQFVEMYVGRRRTIMENALKNLDHFGLKREHGYTRAFVKLEKVKAAKAPRCIQPRAPEYNISVGVFLKHIEHHIYGAIQRSFGSATPIVAKGLNAREVGQVLWDKWSEFSDPVAVGLDAMSFDMHVCAAMLGWEHSVYLSLYAEHHQVSELRRLLKWQIDNHGSGYCYDGKLKYNVLGRRFSGDMNTAMGNCIIMCGVVYSYLNERIDHYQVVNNGDDCVVICERRNLSLLDGLSDHAGTLGFKLVVEKPVYELEQIDFCQASPVELGGGWTMVREPTKAREKDSMSLLHHQNAISVRRWMTAVGECGLALCSGCPMMQEMYLALLRNGVDKGNLHMAMGMDTGASFLAKGMESRATDITPQARISFYRAFGYTPDEQIALELEFKKWSCSGEIGDVAELDVIPVINM